MEIQIIGQTTLYTQSSRNIKPNALNIAGKAARICYSEDDFNTVLEKDTSKVLDIILNSGHHSPFDHTNINLYIKDIPKILAMTLNNEKTYATSEKSARYTAMKLSNEQHEIYDKWNKIFTQEITKTYPKLDKIKTNKLAKENARYTTSVFTPTKMMYTTSFRQLNYTIHFFNQFIDSNTTNSFQNLLKPSMQDFNNQLKELYTKKLDPNLKLRNLSLFTEEKNEIEFGENYSTSYLASFAYLAQAQRHRTLNYEILNTNENGFFTPPILINTEYEKDWIDDLSSLAKTYPQAQLIQIQEYGNHKDFISKCAERLCGNAQLEISLNTKNTLEQYINSTKDSNSKVYNKLSKLNNGPKCTFPNTTCVEGCYFGPIEGLERLI